MWTREPALANGKDLSPMPYHGIKQPNVPCFSSIMQALDMRLGQGQATSEFDTCQLPARVPRSRSDCFRAVVAQCSLPSCARLGKPAGSISSPSLQIPRAVVGQDMAYQAWDWDLLGAESGPVSPQVTRFGARRSPVELIRAPER